MIRIRRSLLSIETESRHQLVNRKRRLLPHALLPVQHHAELALCALLDRHDEKQPLAIARDIDERASIRAESGEAVPDRCSKQNDGGA